MNRERLIEIARAQMIERKEMPARETGHLFWHGLRSARMAVALSQSLALDLDADVLFAAALFHDIGKGNPAHEEVGAHLTTELLCDEATPEEIESIGRIIGVHSKRAQPNDYPDDVRIVQDADLLDHVGPMGVWLALYWGAKYDEDVPKKLDYIHGQEHTELYSAWRALLNFDLSRESFDERVKQEEEYFLRLESAHAGELFPTDQ